MDSVFQISVLTLGVCLGAIALVVRGARSSTSGRISVDPVSSTWLTENRVRTRPE